MGIQLAWKIVIALYILSVIILSIEKAWSIVIYSITYGAGYGGLVYIFRNRIRHFFSGLQRARYPLFILIAILVSVFEELYVYSLGNTIAISNIWLDIIVVPMEWAAWFTGWYFIISRRFSFNEKQALFTAGLAGILFEYSGKGFLLSDPLAIIVFFPIAMVVYAAIFILPMQLIIFSGENNSWLKYPVGVILPFLLSIPVGLLLYFTLII